MLIAGWARVMMKVPMALAFEPPLPPFPPDRYQVLECLGVGGMGRVYRARDRHLNRFVALKFLRREDPHMARRLVLEAQFQAGLEHPGILRVHEVGLLDDAPCIVLQYVDGPDLEALSPCITLTERVELIAQAARAIHAAHQQGLIHRDLKPQNILVETTASGQRQALVMDFGLARPVQESELSLSMSVVGSPFYLSPEQITGAGLDARSDVYSLGATLYAILVGHPPFAQPLGEAPVRSAQDAPTCDLVYSWQSQDPPHFGVETGSFEVPANAGPEAMAVVETLRRVLDDDPIPPRKLVSEVPWDLETVILKCLEKDPARRYESAKALAEDLGRVLSGEPIRAKRGSVAYRLLKAYRRNRSTFLVAGCAVVLMAGLGAWNVVRIARERQAASHAQRYTAEAEQLAQFLRLSHMSPQHDRRPQVAWIRSRMAAVREEMRHLGSAGQGSAHFLLGQCHLVLDEPDEALQHLERAWKLGFRTAAAAAVLAETHLSLLNLELTAARDMEISDFRSQEDQCLRSRHREEALALLKQAHEFPGMEAYRATELAYLQGREEDTLAQTEATLRATPWMYEVLTLTSEIWGLRAQRTTDPGQRRACLERNLADLTRAVGLAPSDPSLRGLLATTHAGLAELEKDPVERERQLQLGMACGQTACEIDPSTTFGRFSKVNVLLTAARLKKGAAALAATEEAKALMDAAQPVTRESLVLSMAVWQARLNALEQEPDRVWALLPQALQQGQSAAAAHPEDPRLAFHVAEFHLRTGSLQERVGGDPRPAFRNALASAERAVKVAPGARNYADYEIFCRLVLGMAGLDRGTWAESYPDLRRGLEGLATYPKESATPSGTLDVGCSACWVLMELAHSAGGDGREAYTVVCRYLDSLLARWPDHSQALLERGRAEISRARDLLERGEDPTQPLSAAKAWLARYIPKAPKRQFPYATQAHIALLEAQHLRARGQSCAMPLREGLESCTKSLAQDPNHHWAMGFKGALLVMQVEGRTDAPAQRQREEGRDLIRKAMAVRPHLGAELRRFL